MKTDQLPDLLVLADALYQHEQRAIAALTAEENAVRSALAAVDAAGTAGRQQLEQVAAQSMTRADIAWSAWAGHRKSVLNTELAQILARKSRESERLRRAFGRREAIRMLQEKSARDDAPV